MKTKDNLLHALPMLVLAGGLTLTGCTDSNYDLGNLDKTLAIGSEEGFALPGNNSTSALVLDDLLDLEGNDFVKVDADGGYYISRGADENEIDPALPVVDEIPLTTVSNESNYDYDLDDVLDVEEARRVEGSESATARPIYEFTFNSLEDIADVVGMSLANLRAGINIDLDFSDNLQLNIDNLESLTIDFPDFFDVDFTERMHTADFDFIKETNTITFRNLKEDGVHLTMTLHGVDFKKGLTPDAHGCYLIFTPENVSLQGSIWIDAKYNTPDMARGKAEHADNLVIHCHSAIDETIMLTSATGYFKPEIDLGDNIGQFEVNNLPDFLDDEDVHLNVDDPQLRIWIDSNMDIKGLISQARIKSTDAKGRETIVDIDANSLYIDPHTGKETNAKGDSLPSTRTTIVICDKLPDLTQVAPHTYYGKAKDGKKLADLLYNIPKKVSFDCSVVADESYEGTIKLGVNPETAQSWYKIQPSYEVYAPLAFNSGSAIVYRDSITGWHEDLDDITLSDGSSVIMTADVYNNMPLDLKMHANALELVGTGSWRDLDKNLIDVKITDMDDNEDFRVKAGTENSTAVTRIKITLTQKDKSGFKKIDGISYSASALASDDDDKQGIVLNNKSQKLQVSNIAVTLRGRVIVDLND